MGNSIVLFDCIDTLYLFTNSNCFVGSRLYCRSTTQMQRADSRLQMLWYMLVTKVLIRYHLKCATIPVDFGSIFIDQLRTRLFMKKAFSIYKDVWYTFTRPTCRNIEKSIICFLLFNKVD